MRRLSLESADGVEFGAGAEPEAGDVLHAARRRSRDTSTMTWTLLYGGVLVVTMVTAMVASVWASAFRTIATQSNPATVAALGAMLLASQILLWCAVGPMHLRPAMARWLGSSPLDRADVLGRTLVVTTGASVGVGVLAGLFVALAAGAGAAGTAGALAVGAAGGLSAHQLALWASATGRSGGLGRAAALVGVSAALVLTGDVHFGWFASSSSGSGTGMGWWILGCAAACVAVASLARSRAWVRHVGAARLRRSGATVERALGALVMLELSAVAARPARGRARSVWPRTAGPIGVVMADMRAVWRRRDEVAGRAAWVVVLWAIDALLAPAFGLGPAVVGVVVIVSAVVAVAARGLSMWLGSSSLWRMFPQRPVVMTASLAATPLVVSTLVALAAAWGSGLGWALGAWVALGSALAATAAVVRRASSPAMEVGSMVETPAGQVPMGILMATLHGPDQVVIWLVVGALGGWPVACASAAGLLARQVWASRPGG